MFIVKGVAGRAQAEAFHQDKDIEEVWENVSEKLIEYQHIFCQTTKLLNSYYTSYY